MRKRRHFLAKINKPQNSSVVGYRGLQKEGARVPCYRRSTDELILFMDLVVTSPSEVLCGCEGRLGGTTI